MQRISMRTATTGAGSSGSRTRFMSDPHHDRTRRFFLHEMIEFCERIRDYTAGYEKAAFIEDSLVYDATIRNLELIGDAAGHMSQSFRDRYPDVPWQEIVGLRNRLIHGYDSIDNDNIWWLVRDVVPKLLPALRDLMHATSEDSP